MGVNIAAALWGFAEATLFFIVPDVWLTAVTVSRGRDAALRAAAWAIAGAAAGGALMYVWGATDSPQALGAVASLPAISSAMIADAHLALSQIGLWQLFLGAMSGVPYKIYAVVAPLAGVPLLPLLLVTVPARALRFVVTILIAAVADRALARNLTRRHRLFILGGFWVLFYAGYFALMSG